MLIIQSRRWGSGSLHFLPPSCHRNLLCGFWLGGCMIYIFFFLIKVSFEVHQMNFDLPPFEFITKDLTIWFWEIPAGVSPGMHPKSILAALVQLIKLNSMSYWGMCSTPKPKHTRIERWLHENDKIEIGSNGCADNEWWIREPTFFICKTMQMGWMNAFKQTCHGFRKRNWMSDEMHENLGFSFCL